MEKLVYLVWLDAQASRADVPAAMLDTVAPELLRLRPHRLSMDLWDPDSDIPAPVPTPPGETPLHVVVSLWLDCVEQRGPFEQVLGEVATTLAGYQVVESLYRDYGGNAWSSPRQWPDGARSPGVLTVALLHRHPAQSFEAWVDRWYTRISPITESIQPRCRYVRNAVFRAVTPGAPQFGGIVEEAWPSLEHVTDPMLFYCADGDPAKMQANVELMINEISAFIELDTMRSTTMSEWILKS